MQATFVLSVHTHKGKGLRQECLSDSCAKQRQKKLLGAWKRAFYPTCSGRSEVNGILEFILYFHWKNLQGWK